MSKHLIFLAVLFVSGCTSVSTAQRPNDYYNSGESTASDEPLFGTNGGVLAEKDIQRILNHSLKLPAQNRVAILKLSSDTYWRNYSNDFTQLSEAIASKFIGKLRSSPRIYDASFLPSMLVPDQRTVPYLREAAARYQADLLLAYRSNCHTFEKYRLVNPDETKAYCSVEVVLLDVRSGIVPFTVVASNEFSAEKVQSDTNFRETIKKAEMAAIARSLEEAVIQLNAFMNDVETLK